jgi:hypothetical protein
VDVQVGALWLSVLEVSAVIPRCAFRTHDALSPNQVIIPRHPGYRTRATPSATSLLISCSSWSVPAPSDAGRCRWQETAPTSLPTPQLSHVLRGENDTGRHGDACRPFAFCLAYFLLRFSR